MKILPEIGWGSSALATTRLWVNVCQICVIPILNYVRLLMIATCEALSDFSFANLAQARALQVSLSRYFFTKITAAFRIFFFTP
jgi:hypothetical protein